MSLRPDSVYRVNLSNQPRPKGDADADSPPKVVQIRLTEQALQQLASAYASAKGGRPNISIDVDPADPLLVIDDSRFPLHAPLPAGGLPSSKASTTADTGSTSTAPHELYKLSKDESTLHRVGIIVTKLSVKPTRDVSAVAQRLKQQKEEEEHRKEERRRALMQGASPHLPASASTRTGINKTLAGVRASSGSPLLTASPLSRSSSLNRLSSLREPNALHSPSLARGVSRDPSPGAGTGSATAAHVRSQGAHYDVTTSARRTDRVFTDSPKVSAVTSSRSSSRLPESDHSIGVSGSSLNHRLSPTDEEDRLQHGDDVRNAGAAQNPLPISGASEAATKKTTKLTTRQRLAKATKAGSRLLTAPERRATPEGHTGPTTNHASPPSKLANSAKHTPAENSIVDASSALHHHSPPKARVKEISLPASSRRSASAQPNKSGQEAAHRSMAISRGRKASPTPISATKIVRDASLTSPTKSSAATLQGTTRKSDNVSSSSKSVTQASSVAPTDKRSAIPSKETKAATLSGDKGSKALDRKDASYRHEVKFMPKEAQSPAVQVVTLKKARQSDAASTVKTHSAQASTSSRPTKMSDVETLETDRPMQTDTHKREHSFTDREAKSLSTSSSSTSAKQANARKIEDDPMDTTQRKRRRTNDFSDSASSRREEHHQPSSGPSTPHTDESFARRREPSRDGPVRQMETTSPRDSQYRAGIPVSASMPSFASSSHRLQTVNEVTERDSRRPKAEAYHDRRRDRSYDEPLDEEYASQDRGRSSHRDRDEEARVTLKAEEEVRTSSHGLPPGSPSAKASSASAERPTRGVGPGATHWSEPWLDVRSRADWHRLAQRFTKTQEEYFQFRQRLEAESERLDRELELAAREEQVAVRSHTSDSDISTEQSLLFSPHKRPVGDIPNSASLSSRNGNSDQVDTHNDDVEMETAVNTSINSRTRSSTRAKPVEDGDDSPEEGEMRSSDDEAGGVADTNHPVATEADKRSPEMSSSLDSLLLASRRSESPDNLAWRSGSTKPSPSSNLGSDGVDRPLSYADLAERVKQLNELHSSLGRMHRVLTDFKAKGAVASVR